MNNVLQISQNSGNLCSWRQFFRLYDVGVGWRISSVSFLGVRFEGKNDTSEHVLSSLAFDMFLAESGLLQLTAGTGASPLLEISDRSGVFKKEEFSSESLDRLMHRLESNDQSRIVADAD